MRNYGFMFTEFVTLGGVRNLCYGKTEFVASRFHPLISLCVNQPLDYCVLLCGFFLLFPPFLLPSNG